MKQIVGIILVVLAIALGIDGVRKFDASSETVKFLGIKISADNESGQTTAFIEIALAVAALAGGITLLRQKK